MTDHRLAPDPGEPFLRQLIDAAAVAIYATDADGAITYCNPAVGELVGRAPRIGAERWCVSWKLFDLEGNPLPHDQCPMAVALREGREVRGVELILERPDGTRRQVASHPTPLFDDAGRLTGAVNVLLDVTARRLAEKRARETRRRYRPIADSLPVGIYTCEAPSGAIGYYNREAARLWGRSPNVGDTDERFCGSLKLYLPDGTFLPHAECPMAVAIRDGCEFRNQEVVIERADGTRAWVLVDIDPFRDAAGNVTGAVNVFRDISKLKRTERALLEQKESLEKVLETVPVAVFIAHDPDCRRISGNRAAAELLRMPQTANFSKTADPEEPPQHFAVMRDGREVPGADLPLQRAARGEVVTGDALDHVFDDGTVAHMIVAAQPLRDAVGQPRGAVASMMDITELRCAERELREVARRKDEFLAVLGHELRNPLAPLRAGVDLLQHAEQDPRLLEAVRGIMERQVAHMSRLVDDLLDLSRISSGRIVLQRETIDMRRVIRAAIELTEPLVLERDHLLIIRSANSDTLLVDGDFDRLKQVIGNLLANASKYMAQGGSITVSAELESDEVVVRVKDTGYGIPPERLRSLFEMFTQVPEHHRWTGGSGLGIGLAFSQRLLAMHGGSIAAESAGLGQGSVFTVRLPLSSCDVEASVGDAPTKSESSRRKILVVDDNVDSADTLRMMLELDGHDVRAVYDPREALRCVEALCPDVVLLDIGLPEIDGYEVARRIRASAAGKDSLLIAVTGWGQEQDKTRALAAGFQSHLTKPVDPATLSAMIAESARVS